MKWFLLEKEVSLPGFWASAIHEFILYNSTEAVLNTCLLHGQQQIQAQAYQRKLHVFVLLTGRKVNKLIRSVQLNTHVHKTSGNKKLWLHWKFTCCCIIQRWMFHYAAHSARELHNSYLLACQSSQYQINVYLISTQWQRQYSVTLSSRLQHIARRTCNCNVSTHAGNGHK